MQTPLRLALAAVIVLGVGVTAVNLLPGSGSVGPGAVPSPTAPPATPTGSPVALAYDPSDPYRINLTLPSGWTGEDSSFVAQKYDGAPPNGMAIAVWVVANVYGDGCSWSGTLRDPRVGPTVDDLAAAIAGFDDRETTTPVDVTIDGFAGKELEMTIPDVDFLQCDEGQFRSWVGQEGGARFHQGPLELSRILILDIDGTRVLVFGRSFPDTSAADVAELNAILDGMQVESLASPSEAP